MNYIIIQIAGKQIPFEYMLTKWYNIDFLKNINIGNYIYLNKILLYKNNLKIQIGKPFLKDSKILVQLIQHIKGEKLIILKTKPKKHYTRIRGHRQFYTRIKLI